jgi:hypothetical protein
MILLRLDIVRPTDELSFGIVCCQIDLYQENVDKSKRNIEDTLRGKFKVKFDTEKEISPHVHVQSLEDFLIMGNASV